VKKLLAVLMLALASLLATPAVAQVPAKPDLIEVIEINGAIGSHTATMVREAVEKINENAKVKAVLLVIDSPGGGSTASANVHQELLKIKVPVVGFCADICASGGVHALMSPSVKFIAVGDETIGGSVGVIMQMTRFGRLLNWAMIDSETFKSGSLKDAGNPTREPTAADRAYLQGIVDLLAQKFYTVVTRARGAKVAPHMDEIKTAKIFIGEDIVRVGLADAVMTRDEAIAKAKELSGSKNAFTREELGKVVKNASEAAQMKPVTPPTDFLRHSMEHVDTLMELVGEVRSGESVKFEYRMPYRF
jgi:protease-4